MRKLGFSLILIILMLVLIPFAGDMALYPVMAKPQHRFSAFYYMFAHAGIIHWAFNSWCILMLHNTFRVHRLVAAYVSASMFALVWSIFAPASSAPVLGFSVILFFFFGYLLPYYWLKDRFFVLTLFVYLGVGFLVPGIAGSFHMALFACGFAYYMCELLFRRTIMFIADNG